MSEAGEIPSKQPEKQEAPTLSGRGTPFSRMEELGQGMTGQAERMLYDPLSDSYPVGLGKWVQQSADFAAQFPPQPGRWVKEPDPETLYLLVIKRPRVARDPQLWGHLSRERAALLSIQDDFRENDAARPARLFGYAVRKSTGEPYLILEDMRRLGEFKPLDQYLREKRGRLSEKEALEIAMKTAIIIKHAHQKSIVYSDHKLADTFWNPQNRHLRLIDWGNARFPEKGREEFIPFGYDREGLARVLFKLITGRDCPPEPKRITREDWETMSQATRDVIGKALYLRKDAYAPFRREDTEKMLSDLQTAYTSVSKVAP